MTIKKVVLIPGDGIGPEIIAAARRVIEHALSGGDMIIEYTEKLAGGAAIDVIGQPLPRDTIEACLSADAVLLGAVGGPKWDKVAPHLRAEKAILGLRKALGLYANLRPVRVPAALATYSPLKSELVADVDIMVVRELTGGVYFGVRCESELNAQGIEQAWDTDIYSRTEVERITHLAARCARSRSKRVVSVDKANVLASSRLWRRVTQDIAAQYPDIEWQNMYVDNCAMQLVLNPRQFDVIVTNNLFGDILSDEAAVLLGSIGLLPSASLGDSTGLFEPIHGSAPELAGQGIANPIGTILSAALMLRIALGNEMAAERIEDAVERTLMAGHVTRDLARSGQQWLSTTAMTDKIIESLQ